MNHYTYEIKHKISNKRYIGVRSCTCAPAEDDYWGSSKYIPKDVKDTHIKTMLKEFSTREDAVSHEILLHNKYNVAVNPEFYNRAKQTATGFDTQGTTLTEEHKQKCSVALKGRYVSDSTRKLIAERMSNRVVSDATKEKSSVTWKAKVANGYVNPRTGVTLSEDTKQKISNSNKGKSIGTKNSRFKPWFISYPTYTDLFYSITKEDQSIQDGFSPPTYQRIFQRSKGTKPMSRGAFKGIIIGNIPVV